MKTRFGMGIKLVGFICFLSACALAAPSAAEKLAGKCPDGTFAFIATSGFEEIGPVFNQSSIGQLWNDPNVKSFLTQIQQTIVTKIKEEIAKDGDAEKSEFVSVIESLLGEAIQCPRLAGVSEAAEGSDQKLPFRFFVMVEAGRHKEKIKSAIDKIEAILGKEQVGDKPLGTLVFRTVKESEIPVAWGWVRETFVFMLNDEKGDTLNGLHSQTVRPAPLSKLADHGDAFALYCDIQKVSSLIANVVEKEGNTADLAKFKNVLTILGLNNVKTVTLRAGFDNQDMVVEKWLEVPAPQTGLFESVKPIDITMLDKVDARAATVMAFNADLGGLYDLVFKVLDSFCETQEKRDEIRAVVTGIEAQWNVKVREGFLKSLDGPMTLFTLPAGAIQEVPMGGFVLTAKLKDGALFAQNMQALGAAIKTNLGDQFVQITSQPLDSGLTATTWTFPQAALMQVLPNWTVVDNCVVISSHPAMTNLVVKQSHAAATENTSIRSLAPFAMMQSKLPKNPVFLQYSDTAANMKQAYTQLQQLWPMATIAATGQGIMLPVMLPPIQDKLGQLGQSWEYSWMDGTGIHSRYQGSGIEITAGSVAGAAMGAAVILPAMSKAKTTAQSVVSMNNLKQIGLACHMYCQENDEKFPPNLEALEKYGIADKVLESPRKPNGFAGPSYIYIEGQTPTSPVGNVLAYEDPSFDNEGKVIAVFVDGHCERMDKAEFQKKLDATNASLEHSGADGDK